MAISVENGQFSHPRVFSAPAEGVPLELGTETRDQKIRMTGLPGGQKSFKIGLTVRRHNTGV